MWRVAAYCLALLLASSSAACLPDLPSLIRPTSLPATPLVQPNSSAQATATLVATPLIGAAPTTFVDTSGTFTPVASFTPSTGAASPAATIITTATIQPTQLTGTPTVFESVSLDKLPPGTVYKRVRIENQSHSQMDISLHCTTIQGLHTVLEYEKVKNLTIEAPEGDYIYVVYVGGRPMSGSFSLLRVPNVTITVYADRVAIH